MTDIVTIGDCTLYHGDCLEVLPGLADSSVDLILTDPPYFRVKGEAWDRAWDTPAKFLAWLDQCAEQWVRVMKPNGSLYCFASPQMAAWVEVLLAERLNVLNSIVWAKNHTPCGSIARRQCVAQLRAFFPEQERIIFAEHYGADNIAKGEAGYGRKCDELRGFVFEPLRAYFDGERKRAGLSNEQIMNGMEARGVGRYMFARHTFTRSQWQLPTEEQYMAARDLFNTQGRRPAPPFSEYHDWQGDPREYMRPGYCGPMSETTGQYPEYLRAEYEDLRRPFRVTANVPYTDVWTFPPVQSYRGKHPCEKPQDLLRHIIQASSRSGGVVLDSFFGSGATAVACEALGRSFVGIEKDEHWHAYAQNRLERIAEDRSSMLFQPNTEEHK